MQHAKINCPYREIRAKFSGYAGEELKGQLKKQLFRELYKKLNELEIIKCKKCSSLKQYIRGSRTGMLLYAKYLNGEV